LPGSTIVSCGAPNDGSVDRRRRPRKTFVLPVVPDLSSPEGIWGRVRKPKAAKIKVLPRSRRSRTRRPRAV